LAREFAVLDDDDGEVGFVDEDGSVADAEDGWGVDEDEVEAGFDVFDEFGHALGVEDAGAVGGEEAAGEEVEVFDGGLDDDFFEGDLGGEVVGEAFLVGDVEEGVEAGAAEVGVDEEDVVTALGADEGEVGEGGGFAFTSAA
jgi:hypothetical protein